MDNVNIVCSLTLMCGHPLTIEFPPDATIEGAVMIAGMLEGVCCLDCSPNLIGSEEGCA